MFGGVGLGAGPGAGLGGVGGPGLAAAAFVILTSLAPFTLLILALGGSLASLNTFGSLPPPLRKPLPIPLLVGACTRGGGPR